MEHPALREERGTTGCGKPSVPCTPSREALAIAFVAAGRRCELPRAVEGSGSSRSELTIASPRWRSSAPRPGRARGRRRARPTRPSSSPKAQLAAAPPGSPVAYARRTGTRRKPSDVRPSGSCAGAPRAPTAGRFRVRSVRPPLSELLSKLRRGPKRSSTRRGDIGQSRSERATRSTTT